MKDLVSKLLENMDIPEKRKDLSIESNVNWLLRNLAIRNWNAPDFKLVMELLTSIKKFNFK